MRACGRLNVTTATAARSASKRTSEDGHGDQVERALEGIRVLDVTQVMAGPFCAMQLSDMGADVIKVEPPDGDSTRRMAGAAGDDSPAFNAVNRGKRGIVLDLKSARRPRRTVAAGSTRRHLHRELPAGRAWRGFGLDYATLATVMPALIYASISGYGQTGPDAAKGGFDLIAQGVSGLMSVTGEPGGPPMKVGVPLTDLGAGLFALSAILAALHYRDRTGRGQYIDTSLVEAGLALSVWEAAQYFADGTMPQAAGIGAPHAGAVSGDPLRRRIHHDRRGHGSAVPAPRQSARPCRMARRSGVSRRDAARAQPRGADRARSKRSRLASRARTGWRCSTREGIPCGPINTYAEAFADPQLRARDMIVEIDHPAHGRQQTLGSPIKMSATPPVIARRAPTLGEHTREVLQEAGFTEEEIRALL